jgi:hypothetical protein
MSEAGKQAALDRKAVGPQGRVGLRLFRGWNHAVGLSVEKQQPCAVRRLERRRGGEAAGERDASRHRPETTASSSIIEP